jgi:hypothetical protein
MVSSASSSAPWRSGLQGARAHFWPGVALQAVALALVVGYYHLALARAAFTRLMELKLEVGSGFGVITTGLFAGLLPFLYLHSAKYRGGRAHYTWGQGLGLTAFWAYKGIEIDLFYRLLARWVGAGHGVATIAEKALIDQFFYCPVFAVPVTVLVYQWVENHFDFQVLLADMRAPQWYRRRVLPVMISNLGVWIPAVAIIYALPTPLELPLQNLVLCFFTLMIAHQTRAQAAERAEALDVPL